MQFTTRAVTVIAAGRPSNRTVVPISSGRPNLAAHPCGFTSSVRHDSEKECAGFRLERVIAISKLIRVPRRTALWLENELNFKFNNS